MRPKQPKFTDHTDLNSYLELNRYFNQAERQFDRLERWHRKFKELAEQYLKQGIYLPIGIVQWLCELDEIDSELGENSEQS